MPNLICRKTAVGEKFNSTRDSIVSIEDLCEKENGFVVSQKPTGKEILYIRILEDCIDAVFKDLICYESFPPIEIVTSKATFAGLAHQLKRRNRIEPNKFGMESAFIINRIFLKKYLFDVGGFSSALTTYLHELLHQFGGDNSKCFIKGLSIMNILIIENQPVIEKYKQKWEKI